MFEEFLERVQKCYEKVIHLERADRNIYSEEHISQLRIMGSVIEEFCKIVEEFFEMARKMKLKKKEKYEYICTYLSFFSRDKITNLKDEVTVSGTCSWIMLAPPGPTCGFGRDLALEVLRRTHKDIDYCDLSYIDEDDGCVVIRGIEFWSPRNFI